MKDVLIFMAGTMIGGTIGIIAMCLCQINRIRYDTDGKENEDDEQAND